MTTKAILTDPKVYADRIIDIYEGDAVTAYLCFEHACKTDPKFASTRSWNDAVYDALGCAGTDELRIARQLDCSGPQACIVLKVLDSIAVFARSAFDAVLAAEEIACQNEDQAELAHAADLKAKGEQLAAEIELVCETLAVFARAAYRAGRALLNIGLHVGQAPYLTYLPVFSALRTVRHHGGVFRDSAVRKSGTEDTLVIDLDEPLNARVLAELSSALNQEAIAQWSSRGGELRGPKAEAWGEFDPSQFLLLDGRRLSAVIGG